MKLNYLEQKGIVVLTIQGSIDENGALTLDTNIKKNFQRRKRRIAIDFKDVEYIGPFGIQKLSENILVARKRAGDIKVFHVNSSVQGIFRASGFTKKYALHKDFSEVITSFKKDRKLLQEKTEIDCKTVQPKMPQNQEETYENTVITAKRKAKPQSNVAEDFTKSPTAITENQFGRYKILGFIGQGGMARVY